MKKSQMAIEFVILVGMGILIAMTLVIVIYSMNSDRTQEKINSKMKDFGFSIQNELILASEMNEGYSRNITLDNKIEYTDYNISIFNGSKVMIDYAGRILYYSIPNTVGLLVKGNNLLRNQEGTVYITQ